MISNGGSSSTPAWSLVFVLLLACSFFAPPFAKALALTTTRQNLQQQRLRGGPPPGGAANRGDDAEESRRAGSLAAAKISDASHATKSLLNSSSSSSLQQRRSFTACRFKAFSDEVSGQERSANRSALVFRQGSSLVIEQEEHLDGELEVSRYLLFANGDGTCHEEALVRCTNIESVGGQQQETAANKPAAAEDPRAAADGVSGRAFSSCAARRCRPRALVALSYARSMVGGFAAAVPDARRGLMIGVGGGMIPLWVQEARPRMRLDAVDVAKDVLAAAPCFGLPARFHSDEELEEDGADHSSLPSRQRAAKEDQADVSSNVRLVLADGRAFLERQPFNSYDVIFLDVYTPQDDLPPCLSTVEFFQAIRDRLRPDGVLVWNTHPSTEEELAELLRVAGAVFPHLAFGQAVGEGNQIILASQNQTLPPPKAPEDKAVGMWYAAANFQPVENDAGATTTSMEAAHPSSQSPRRDAHWCPSAAAREILSSLDRALAKPPVVKAPRRPSRRRNHPRAAASAA